MNQLATIDPRVQITDLDIPFWGLVSLLIKLYFALLAASLIIAVIFAAAWFAFAIVSGVSIFAAFN